MPQRKAERNSLHCKIFIKRNNAKPTHLCCGIVKQISVWLSAGLGR